MAGVVLVHGAWHGAWCWEQVVALLAERGVAVVAVDLPGHGEDHGAFADLYGDAAQVREALDAAGPGTTLVGHSYGGAVISEAGSHPNVAHLVYVAAFVVGEGQSCVSMAIEAGIVPEGADDPDASAAAAAASAGEEGVGREQGGPSLGDAIVFADDGTTSTIRSDLAGAVFYHRCPPAVAAAATDRLGPQPMANLGQPGVEAAWQTRPATYVVCGDDQAVHPPLQRAMAARCTHAVELDADHSPFYSAPEALAEVVAAAERPGEPG